MGRPAYQSPFVGGECAGDLREAALLEEAISAGLRQSDPARRHGLSCSRTVVPGSDHGVAAAMRDSGALQEALLRYCK